MYSENDKDLHVSERILHRFGSRESEHHTNVLLWCLNGSRYGMTRLLQIRKITQCEFAKMMDTRQPHINDWFSGVKSPCDENLLKMSEILEIDYEVMKRWRVNVKEEYKRQRKIKENVKEIKRELERIREEEIGQRTDFFKR